MSTSERIANKVEGIAPPLPVFCTSVIRLWFLLIISSHRSLTLTIKLLNPHLLGKPKIYSPGNHLQRIRLHFRANWIRPWWRARQGAYHQSCRMSCLFLFPEIPSYHLIPIVFWSADGIGWGYIDWLLYNGCRTKLWTISMPFSKRTEQVWNIPSNSPSLCVLSFSPVPFFLHWPCFRYAQNNRSRRTTHSPSLTKPTPNVSLALPRLEVVSVSRLYQRVRMLRLNVLPFCPTRQSCRTIKTWKYLQKCIGNSLDYALHSFKPWRPNWDMSWIKASTILSSTLLSTAQAHRQDTALSH